MYLLANVKPKDEVTLLSPGVLFWLILECSKLQFFPHSFLWVPIFDPNTRLRRGFFSPTYHCIKMCVCSGGKLRKSSQVLYRSDQGKYFLKINQNYFAHICPEYGFRVKMNFLLYFKQRTN